MEKLKVLLMKASALLTAASHLAANERATAAVALTTLLAACSPSFHPGTAPLAKEIASDVGCTDLKSQLWTQLYKIADDPRGFPSAEELETALSEALKVNSKSKAHANLIEKVSEEAATIYDEVVKEVTRKPGQRPQDIMQELAGVELGDEETPERAELQKRLHQALTNISMMAKTADLACEKPPTEPPPTEPPSNQQPPTEPQPETPQPSRVSVEGELLDSWKATVATPVYGAWKTMATALQSCEAVKLEPLDENTPNVQGITVNHDKVPESGGLWREITNLTSFLRSNPYFRNYLRPDAGCFDVEAKPLIYDFGGKPEYSSSLDSDLDLFTNNGSGATNQLGIDCSGFVMTAFLTAGLKIKHDDPQRPQFAGAVPARNFMRPDGNMKKLNCFQYVSATNARVLKPGDVLASETHVVMIDTVSDDPFGLAGVTAKSQCTLANMKTSHFDFTIVHSGSVKNGLGISRMHASGYFTDDSAMGSALRAYALAACKAKFSDTSTPMPSEARVVRHSGEARCIDRQVPLRKSACLKTCR